MEHTFRQLPPDGRRDERFHPGGAKVVVSKPEFTYATEVRRVDERSHAIVTETIVLQTEGSQ
jgi:hypothetical protein